MSFIRHFAFPLFGLALWFAVAFAVLATFARPQLVVPQEEAPEVVLVAPPAPVTECCDCCNQS